VNYQSDPFLLHDFLKALTAKSATEHISSKPTNTEQLESGRADDAAREQFLQSGRTPAGCETHRPVRRHRDRGHPHAGPLPTGSVCFLLPEVDALFSGDTLFAGGPGATGRSYSHFTTIIESIRERVLTLPPHTQVFTGHGDATTIDGEAPFLDQWIARGH